MKIIAPDYYGRFACLAGACRHSCCIGWEIDIDEDALAYYRAIPGDLGRRLAGSIVQGNEGAHFRMLEDERCPFLNREGLCDLIIGLGEDCLCQICDDHPRFRNFYSDREETGLGLCCEAAGRLILGQEEPVSLNTIEDDGFEEDSDPDEEDILHLRSRLISIAQDRKHAMQERAASILAEFGLGAEDVHMPDRVGFLSGLERLDNAWAHLLEDHADAGMGLSHPSICEVPLEQMMVYLLYRHVAAALDDGDLKGRITFILFIWQLIRDLFASAAAGKEGFGLEDMVEIARMYSSEIEYSDENISAIIAGLKGNK